MASDAVPSMASAPAESSQPDAFTELVAQASKHFANLRRLARQRFPQARTALEPFLVTVHTLLAQLERPGAMDSGALAQQLEASLEALDHLDALLEAFSMRPG